MSLIREDVSACVYLVDDLPAELDARHCALVCESLEELQAQVFITCVAKSDLEGLWPAGVAHVEHGGVHSAAIPDVEDGGAQIARREHQD